MNVEIPDFHDNNLEQRVIESLIRDGSYAYDDIAEILSASDFYEKRNRELFLLLQKHFENGDASVDRAIIANEMQSDDFSPISLTELDLWSKLEFDTSSIKDFAEALQELKKKRKLCRIVEDIASLVQDGGRCSADFLQNEMIRMLMEIDEPVPDEYLVDAYTVAVDFQQKITERDFEPTIPTGIEQLDSVLEGGGFKPGTLNIIGARPAAGKSVLANQIALNMLQHDRGHERKPIVVFSLEMNRMEIMGRYFSSFASVTVNDLKQGILSPEDWRSLEVGIHSTLYHEEETPRLLICDRSGLSLKDMQSYLAQVARKYDGVGAVILDYLQLMTVDMRNQTRANALGEISGALKVMAGVYKMPVIAVCQLNREAEKEEKPKPTDIRDSGNIEQDADFIVIIRKIAERENSRRLYVVKNRQGGLTDFDLSFEGQFSRFVTSY